MDRGAVRLFPDNYARSRHGRGPDLAITVEADTEGGDVLLTIEADAHETKDDLDLWRAISPEEAEELAAMLRHHARAQRRRWRR